MARAAKGYKKFTTLFQKAPGVRRRISFGQQRENTSGYNNELKFTPDNLTMMLKDISSQDSISIEASDSSNLIICDRSEIFKYIDLNCQGTANNYFKKITIGTAQLQPRNPITQFDSCKIGYARIDGSVSGDIIFKNTCIGNLVIKAEGLYNLILIDCTILELSFYKEAKPYSILMQGCDFSPKNVEVSDDHAELSLPKVDRQAFSNLRNWAEENSDGRTAHIARGAELAVETHQEQGFTKFMLHLWCIFGNYGLSPLRSIAWLVAFWLLMAGALFNTETVLELPTGAGAEIGWRVSLTGEDQGAQMFRAAIAASNSAINPFSIFGVRNLVVPKDSIVATLMPIHGLISIGLILLTGFSLRRRLKLV